MNGLASEILALSLEHIELVPVTVPIAVSVALAAGTPEAKAFLTSLEENWRHDERPGV